MTTKNKHFFQNLNLANLLTLLRILFVPCVVVLLNNPTPFRCYISAFFFSIAAMTDFLDGYLARRTNTVTSLGKFLDPLADKLLVCSVLIMLVQLQWIAGWIAIVIIARELMVTGLRAIAADEGIVIAADKYGKMKTCFQIFALFLLIIHYPVFGLDPNPLGEIFLYIALALTIFSGGNYFYSFMSGWGKKAH